MSTKGGHAVADSDYGVPNEDDKIARAPRIGTPCVHLGRIVQILFILETERKKERKKDGNHTVAGFPGYRLGATETGAPVVAYCWSHRAWTAEEHGQNQAQVRNTFPRRGPSSCSCGRMAATPPHPT